MATKAKGLYLQNVTRNIITYTAPDKAFTLSVRPFEEVGDTQYIPENYADDMGIRRLINKGICKVVSGTEAVDSEQEQYAEAETKRSERRSKHLDNIDNSHEGDLLRVDCCAKTASGKACSRKVTVTAKDVDKAGITLVPVFCKQHADVDPSAYARSNGGWGLKEG